MLVGTLPSVESKPIPPKLSPSNVDGSYLTTIIPLSVSAPVWLTWSLFFGVVVPIPILP